jgi:RNA polymerase sigma-70 factor, ECF subfamily
MNRGDDSMPSSVADLAELGRLFEEHRPKLLAMLERRIDPALAVRLAPEDILSEAFLQARRKWARYKEQSALTPYAWLYRIALDCLIEAWRHATRGRRDLRGEMPLPDASSVQLGLGLVSPGTSPSAAAARHELQQAMRQARDLLKEPDRTILWLRHYDGLSFAEAAMILDISENTATMRYVRAMRRLKSLWQELHAKTEGEP